MAHLHSSVHAMSQEQHCSRMEILQGLHSQLSNLRTYDFCGEVISIVGSKIMASGLDSATVLGSIVTIEGRSGTEIRAEVVGFEKSFTVLMSYDQLGDIGPGCSVYDRGESANLFPYHTWLGRIVDGFGRPIDGQGALTKGVKAYRLQNVPPRSHQRRMVTERLDLGIRAMNTFTTCCRGQRMGIFAGSGVGKSMLLSMLARFSDADVIVIGLIGERGREVREFLERYLGPEGQSRCVTVVSTSDEAALMRRRAAYATVAIAEYFRDQGLDVLCLMDSVTRFAMALREIGLARGEPPTTKGYTPNVFTELPQLLERTGPGYDNDRGQGNITGLFTVLVEGDDTNEPVSDTVRGILDGHIILDRKIAERGRFPAINVLRSVSRTMPDCNNEDETSAINMARNYLSTYDDMEELIRLGAYRSGTNPEVDEAIFYAQELEGFLKQDRESPINLGQGFTELQGILETPPASS